MRIWTDGGLPSVFQPEYRMHVLSQIAINAGSALYRHTGLPYMYGVCCMVYGVWVCSIGLLHAVWVCPRGHCSPVCLTYTSAYRYIQGTESLDHCTALGPNLHTLFHAIIILHFWYPNCNVTFAPKSLHIPYTCRKRKKERERGKKKKAQALLRPSGQGPTALTMAG